MANNDFEARISALEADLIAIKEAIAALTTRFDGMGDVSEIKSLAQHSADEAATATATLTEMLDKARAMEVTIGDMSDGVARIEAQGTSADPALDDRLRRIEIDQKRILEMPAFTTSAVDASGDGEYQKPNDQYPKGLLSFILETYYGAEIRAYNRAAEDQRKAGGALKPA